MNRYGNREYAILLPFRKNCSKSSLKKKLLHSG